MVKICVKIKETAWRRFHREYVVALRERNNLNHKDKLADIEISDVVIIKGESKNRGYWKFATVENVHSWNGNVIRAVELRTSKNYLEQPIQLL